MTTTKKRTKKLTSRPSPSMQEALYVALLGHVDITDTQRTPEELEELARRARTYALGFSSYFYNA